MEEILRIANGDELAFSRVFHRYRDKIYAVAFKLTDSSFIAAEVVQEVFLKVWTRRDTLPGISDFEGYLFIMARNCVFTHLKKNARRQTTESEWHSNTDPIGSCDGDHLVADEYAAVLDKAIDALPLQQRQVYLLSNHEDLSRNEIAELLRISPETVKTHLSRAVKTVKNYCAVRLDITISLVVMLLC